MCLFKKINWKEIQVNLESGEFSLKIDDEKKANIAAGKISRHSPKNMTFDHTTDVLTLKAEKTISFKEVVDAFEEMIS